MANTLAVCVQTTFLFRFMKPNWELRFFFAVIQPISRAHSGCDSRVIVVCTLKLCPQKLAFGVRDPKLCVCGVHHAGH